MSQVYHFQNFYVTRLREAVDESSTTIYVDNPPTISSGILVLEGKNASKREIIYFSSVSGYALNDCVRGLEGTTPNTHNQGATIEQAVTAGQLDQVLSPHILLQGLGNDENAAMSQDAVTRVITKAHNADGTLKANSVTAAAVANKAITADKLDSASYYASLALADLNGWKRYVNPVNGKIRYYRSGTATGAAGNAGGFQYVNTGIGLPANTRIISASCGVRDQATSATCILNVGNVRFAAQTFFSPVTPVIDWYWELEEI